MLCFRSGDASEGIGAVAEGERNLGTRFDQSTRTRARRVRRPGLGIVENHPRNEETGFAPDECIGDIPCEQLFRRRPRVLSEPGEGHHICDTQVRVDLVHTNIDIIAAVVGDFQGVSGCLLRFLSLVAF
jgi:hypothetical protein